MAEYLYTSYTSYIIGRLPEGRRVIERSFLRVNLCSSIFYRYNAFKYSSKYPGIFYVRSEMEGAEGSTVQSHLFEILK